MLGRVQMGGQVSKDKVTECKLYSEGSAIKICMKSGTGFCPDDKGCYDYCVFYKYVLGGRCTTDGTNLCCCIKEDGSLHGTP
ncbi:hypothetical protein VNO78_25862 [Psophocarpus tetragonolobus]|uniref:Uncharacterized protein n=1 Tax=Psophocarpus tetragonolobus TaxID=3891 RepID=A0AAN9XFC6_PSOTE